MQNDLSSFSTAKLYLIRSILFFKQICCLDSKSSRSLSEAPLGFFISFVLDGASLFKGIFIFFFPGGFALFLCFLLLLFFLSRCEVKLFVIIFEFSLLSLLSWDKLFSSIRLLSSITRLSKWSSFSSFLSTELSIIGNSLLLIKSFLFSSVFNSEWFSSNSLFFIISEGWSKIWFS